MYSLKYGVSPSIREIARACKVSSTSVMKGHVDWLVHNGYLARDSTKARGLTVTGKVLFGTFTSATIGQLLRKQLCLLEDETFGVESKEDE